MFGGFKKRLKEAVEKVSGAISGSSSEEKIIQGAIEPQPPIETILHEPMNIEAPGESDPEKEEQFVVVKEKLPETPVTNTAEIKAEAKLIVEDDSLNDAIKKGIREEERKKFAEEIDEVLEETADDKERNIIELKEEAKLITETPTLQEIIAEVVKEKQPDAEIEAARIITRIEKEQAEDGKRYVEAEKELNRIGKQVERQIRPEPPKRGLFQKITGKTLTDHDFNDISTELSMALLENDVSVEVKDRIMEELKKQLVGSFVPRGRIEEIIEEALRKAVVDVLHQDKLDLDTLIESHSGPFTIMVVGFNGAGKTTTIAKLAHRLKKYNPVLAAGDTFRAASIEQIEEHGRRLNLRVIKHTYGSDSAAVIFDARKHAEASGNKVVLADTAGRAHSNVNLMEELSKIARVNHPDMKILVLDSITGNDIYEQCRLFDEAVNVDAIILTKADVYERGGAALSAVYTLKKPVLFLGTGQEYDDLKDFNPEEIADLLLKGE